MADQTKRVRSTASDVPDHYDDVDEQLLRDYPELQPIFDRLAAEVDAEPPFDGNLRDLIEKGK